MFFSQKLGLFLQEVPFYLLLLKVTYSLAFKHLKVLDQMVRTWLSFVRYPNYPCMKITIYTFYPKIPGIQYFFWQKSKFIWFKFQAALELDLYMWQAWWDIWSSIVAHIFMIMMGASGGKFGPLYKHLHNQFVVVSIA